MTAIRKCFRQLPRWVGIAAALLLAGLFLLITFGENAFSHAYANQTPLSSLKAGLAGLALAALLVYGGARAKARAEYPVWRIAVLFGLVLVMQLTVAICCWYPLGWDPGASHTAAEEMARGLPLSMPDYFDLCPNNAPIALVMSVFLRVAIAAGMRVPYVILPCLDAVLMNLSAFLCVLCVRRLTQNPVARLFTLIVSIGWIALSPYILYPYTDTFAILFPVLAFYCWLVIRKPVIKWFLIALICSFGAAMKPTALIALIALVGLGVCGFLSQKPEKGCGKRAVLLAFAFVLGFVPGQVYQKASTAYVAGSAVPQGQLSMTHYLMLGMNEATYGGHSAGDVDFSQSYETLEEREKANLARAWERVTARNLRDNVKFFVIKAYKAYADGTFAVNRSFLQLEVPERCDGLSAFLRSLYHPDGQRMPLCTAAVQILWLGLLGLCALASFRHRRSAAAAVLGLTLIGLTAYLLLFEVWPRYLFLYSPFFVILAALALVKPADSML